MALSNINVVSTNIVYKNANGVSVTIALATKLSHKVENGIATIRTASQLITEPLYNLLIGSNAAPITDNKLAADVLDTLLYVVMPEYADNAAAVLAGLAVDALYRTGDAVKIVHA